MDEKSQIQALNRTQPVLPMGLGYVEGVTHDYVRHGTTTLFAALDIATGGCFHRVQAPPSASGVPVLSAQHGRPCPAEMDAHLIVDNYATHKHPKVRTWLGATSPLSHALHADLFRPG